MSFSIRARVLSFQHAFAGIWAMLRTQHNAWIHAVATAVVVAAGFGFEIERGEWLAVVLSVAIVWTAEAINTAFEALCDVASPDFHPQVKLAKDVAAAAVLVSAMGAVVIGAIVFGPRLLALLALA